MFSKASALSETPIIKENSLFAKIQNLSELGALLANRRKRRQLSLATISEELKLKTQYLEAIESGKWENLPSPIYGRGYLRQYAEYLDFSAKDATECCQRLQGKVMQSLHYREIASTQEHPSRSNLWLSFFSLLGLMVVWLWLQKPINYGLHDIEKPSYLSKSTFTSNIILSDNIVASCLNIPHNRIVPCYGRSTKLPSILLTSATPYPIWMR